MIKFIKKHFSSALSFIIGLLIVFVITLSAEAGVSAYNSYIIRADDFFFESSVKVPDFYVGENPLVLYDRTIKQNFVGSFTTEVRDMKTGLTVCRGEQKDISYDIDDKLDASKINLDWYIGSECHTKLSIGSYTIKTTYTINAENIPTKYLRTLSNIFNVNSLQ